MSKYTQVNVRRDIRDKLIHASVFQGKHIVDIVGDAVEDYLVKHRLDAMVKNNIRQANKRRISGE